MWRGCIVLVATLGCGSRAVEAPRPPPPAAAAGHLVVQGTPPVPALRVPRLLWQSGPAWSGLVRSIGSELIVQDPATGAVRDRIPTSAMPFYFGVTTDGAVLCVALERAVLDPKGPVLRPSAQYLLAGWSLTERRWLWQREDVANGLLVGNGQCAFLRNVGTPDAHGFYKHELVVRDARSGETLGAPRPMSVPGVSRTTLQVSGDGRWALYPTTTQVGYADGQTPAWLLYRIADFSPVMRWAGTCASFDAHGALLLDAAARTQQATTIAKLGLASGACTPLPVRFGPAGLFAPSPDGAAALTMQRESEGIELAVRDRDGTLRTALTAATEVARVAARRDGSRVFVLEAGALREWDLIADTEPRTLATGVVAGPCLDGEGTMLAWIAGGALHRRELASGRDTTLALTSPASAALRCAVGTSGTVAVLASGEPSSLSISDGTSWHAVDLKGRTDIRALVVAGDRVVALDRRGLRAWSTAGKLLSTRDVSALALAASADGATIATAAVRDDGARIELADAATLSPRTALDAGVFAHSIRSLDIGADSVSIVGAPTLDGCDTARCFVETIAVDGKHPTQLVTLDGLGTVAIGSALLVQASVDRRGVRVMSRDGHTRASFGSIGDGWFAYDAHGYFACRGDGCAAFRCSVNATLTELTACAGDRVNGLGKLLGNG